MDTGDVNALVEKHLPYARKVARGYMKRALELDDLEQEAAIALWEAAQKFQPDQNPGVPFVAFARPFLVRRLGALACPAALASLPLDLGSPQDLRSEVAGDELWSAMDTLTDRERDIVIKRYGLHGGVPAEISDLAQRFGVGYRRMTELLELARRKLKVELESRGWRDRSRAAAQPQIKTA
jgi:RNA polymerase sigma factor (sigma-70 family)